MNYSIFQFRRNFGHFFHRNAVAGSEDQAERESGDEVGCGAAG